MKRIGDIEINEAKGKGRRKGGGKNGIGGGSKIPDKQKKSKPSSNGNKMPYTKSQSQAQRMLFITALNYKTGKLTKEKIEEFLAKRVSQGKLQRNQIPKRIERIESLSKMSTTKLKKLIKVSDPKSLPYYKDGSGPIQLREPSIKPKVKEDVDMFSLHGDDKLLEEVEFVLDNIKKQQIDQIEEGRTISIKRKYAQHNEITAGRFAPVRSTILKHVSENGICSKKDLTDFIKLQNEENGKTTSTTWIKKNSKYIVEFKKGGESYYRLTKLGYSVLKKTTVNELDEYTDVFEKLDKCYGVPDNILIELKNKIKQ